LRLPNKYFLNKKLGWVKADKFFIDGYGSIHRREFNGNILWTDYQRDISYSKFNNSFKDLEFIYKKFLTKIN
jgi:hypothetical protein